MTKTICFLDWSKPYITLFDQTLWSLHNLAWEVDNKCIIAVKYPNIDQGNPDDVYFKSNVLIGRCIFVHISWYIIELKSFNKTIAAFWYRLTRYLSTQEVIITSAIGLGHYHFFWVDKSLCQPYQKSL